MNLVLVISQTTPELVFNAFRSVERIAVLAATYPAVWGICQMFTGALSDRVGRKWGWSGPSRRWGC